MSAIRTLTECLLQEYVNATISDWSAHSDKVQLLTYQLEHDKGLVNRLNVAVNVDGRYAPLTCHPVPTQLCLDCWSNRHLHDACTTAAAAAKRMTPPCRAQSYHTRKASRGGWVPAVPAEAVTTSTGQARSMPWKARMGSCRHCGEVTWHTARTRQPGDTQRAMEVGQARQQLLLQRTVYIRTAHCKYTVQAAAPGACWQGLKCT